MSPSTILAATLPVYLTMLAGLIVRKVGWLPKEADSGIMLLCVRFLTPCLAIARIVGNPALRDGKQVLLAAVIGYFSIVISMLICYGIGVLIGLKRGHGVRTFALTTGLQNYGFVAIPVIEALFGPQLIGVLFTYTLGVELALWTVGVSLLTGANKAPWRHALNPPVLGIVGSLALHYLGVADLMSEPVHKIFFTFFGQVGSCAIPLSVLLIGATIGDLIGTQRINWKVAISSPILRLLILPFLFLAIGRWIPMSVELKRVLSVQAAMPCAVFTIVMARHYGGHASTAVLCVLSTTLVSIFTVPWALDFALRFVGAY